MKVLITGTSGLIGNALARSLGSSHTVVGMGRRNHDIDGVEYLRGNFADFEDLRKLDGHSFDAVIHLAAVTGGCSEKDGILVNVEGSRCLMRYLIDSGCRKFIMASSIAAIGIQHINSRPRSLPVDDYHPCLDSEGYGFSKFMMEEITKYHSRQIPDIDVINLRLASIMPESGIREPGGVTELRQWAMGGITVMLLQDAVRAFTAALEAPKKPGVRNLNATAPEAWINVATSTVLRNWWGDNVDLSWYDNPGNTYKAIFDVTRIADEIGFTADATLKTLRAFARG